MSRYYTAIIRVGKPREGDGQLEKPDSPRPTPDVCAEHLDAFHPSGASIQLSLMLQNCVYLRLINAIFCFRVSLKHL